MSSRMRKLNSRFSMLILLVPLLCNLVLFSQVAYAEAKNTAVATCQPKVKTDYWMPLKMPVKCRLPDVIGAGEGQSNSDG